MTVELVMSNPAQRPGEDPAGRLAVHDKALGAVAREAWHATSTGATGSAVTTVQAITDGAYPGAVKAGGVCLYSLNEPSPSVSGPISYDSSTRRVHIPYTLYTAAAQGLLNVSVTVYYNAGNGWVEAASKAWTTGTWWETW